MTGEADYGPTMVVDKFFGDDGIRDWSPWYAHPGIRGWFVQGHDEKDEYQELVLKEYEFDWSVVRGWIDWHRRPLYIGDVLLTG